MDSVGWPSSLGQCQRRWNDFKFKNSMMHLSPGASVRDNGDACLFACECANFLFVCFCNLYHRVLVLFSVGLNVCWMSSCWHNIGDNVNIPVSCPFKTMMPKWFFIEKTGSMNFSSWQTPKIWWKPTGLLSDMKFVKRFTRLQFWRPKYIKSHQTQRLLIYHSSA